MIAAQPSRILPSAQPAAPGPAPDPRLHVVLFSGGRGAHSICEAMLRYPRIALTILINAYDDGHSTGRIRRFIPGMLGPSDVRKNLDRLMPTGECYRALRFVCDYRLPESNCSRDGLALAGELADGRYECLPAPARSEFEKLTLRQAKGIFRYFANFHQYSLDELRHGREFDYSDCALGNILFAGCYLGAGRDFNRAIDELASFHEIRAELLNITRGENLFLAARRADGSVLRGEAEIVSVSNGSPIAELALIEERTYRDQVENGGIPAAEIARRLHSWKRLPDLNPRAETALRRADVILYGPGTQHSSLLPSYLTRGVAEAVAANRDADKVFVCNIRRDVDLPEESAAEIVSKFYRAMSRDGEVRLHWRDAATHFFLQSPPAGPGAGDPRYVPFDPGAFAFPSEALRLKDWESSDGKHAGGCVFNELQELLRRRLDTVLEPFRHLVSIIVPLYNEAPTVEAALRELTALDLQRANMSKEILVVDGGSTDGSADIAASVPGVRVLRLEAGRGRGAAMLHGVDHARGDTIAFFPADLEYRTADIDRVLAAVAANEYRAVFGTRNVKCTDLSRRLSAIYGESRGLYLMSKYGGMLLSIVTLLLFNRYVSDPLTCLMAFDASLLRSLRLRGQGLDIQTEMVAKLCARHEFILELPVDYQPRTRAGGKKTTPLDGFRALLPLFRCKYQRGLS